MVASAKTPEILGYHARIDVRSPAGHLVHLDTMVDDFMMHDEIIHECARQLKVGTAGEVVTAIQSGRRINSVIKKCCIAEPEVVVHCANPVYQWDQRV